MLVKPDMLDSIENGLLPRLGELCLIAGIDMGDPTCDVLSIMPADDEGANEATDRGTPSPPPCMPIEAVANPSGRFPSSSRFD